MYRKNSGKIKHQFSVRKGFVLMVVVGVLGLNTSMSMGLISDDRQEVIQGQGEIGQTIIEGEVTRVQGEFVGKDFSQMKDQRYIVETPFGRAWDLHFGENTRKIGDIFLGDRVKASIGKDGSLQTVQKIEQNKANPKHAMVLRSIKGMLEKRKGNFLYVKLGDRTEIVHLDPQSVLEGNIREGSKIVAQLGEAGYGIKIQELKGEAEATSK
ncbi:hypothetical protein [Candidatus Nitrospira allomarina]|jgi:hypothetical protein|uniref:DUF5666 domain-containing protein n=1 Tax=Candidatus Nitrospira allomarina TaxID=3020900 RepID=A0AA96JUD7_9BACT|nr:hypothetical protein [Candidatus Nitrospira allomarina]WNM60015.1 hypothetical protein PP769_09725 [Candidatus Nitrospira allomarina]